MKAILNKFSVLGYILVVSLAEFSNARTYESNIPLEHELALPSSFQDRLLAYLQFHQKQSKRGYWKNEPILKKMYCDVLENYADLLTKLQLTRSDVDRAVSLRNLESELNAKRKRRDANEQFETKRVKFQSHKKDSSRDALNNDKTLEHAVSKLRTKRSFRQLRAGRGLSSRKITKRLRQIIAYSGRLNRNNDLEDSSSGDDSTDGLTVDNFFLTPPSKGREKLLSNRKHSSNRHMYISARKRGQKSDSERNLEELLNTNPYFQPCDMSYRNYCFNGGMCMKLVKLNEVSCRCPEGYTGIRCEAMSNQSVLQILEYGIFLGAAGISTVAKECGKPEFAYLGLFGHN